MRIVNKSIRRRLDGIKKSPGVYIFRDQKNKILYIGKAKNLCSRVRSYFRANNDGRPLIPRIAGETKRIKTIETNSEVEAILLEAKLIKKIKPPCNARQKDDKSFIYIFINFSDLLPRVQFIRQKEVLEERIKQRKQDKLFGPFISAHEIKKLLNYFRLIIPFRDCADAKFKKYQRLGRGCQWAELDKCSAPCTSVEIKEYRRNISRLSRLLSGKICGVKKELLREMKAESKNKKFERAAEIRDRIKTIDHIKEVSMINDYTNLVSPTYEIGERRRDELQVEAVDISNISGKYAVGSIIRADCQMSRSKCQIKSQIPKIKFLKSGYRRFRIRTKSEPDDVGMMREVVKRRFNHPEWKFPDLLIIDGGKGQLKAANQELSLRPGRLRPRGIKNQEINLVAIAKGPTRKGEKLFFSRNFDPKLKSTLIKDKKVIKLMRDEAHRFAVSYHRILRKKGLLGR